MAIYMAYKSGAVKGNCTAEGYKDHIVLDHVGMGLSRAVSMVTGDSANRESSRPAFQEISCSKRLDAGVIAMFKQAAVGEKGETVTIKFCNTGADKIEEYQSVELENAIISSYSMSCDSEGTPMENFTISFSQMTLKYADTDAKGGAGSQKVIGYSIEKGKLV